MLQTKQRFMIIWLLVSVQLARAWNFRVLQAKPASAEKKLSFQNYMNSEMLSWVSFSDFKQVGQLIVIANIDAEIQLIFHPIFTCVNLSCLMSVAQLCACWLIKIASKTSRLNKQWKLKKKLFANAFTYHKCLCIYTN